MDEKTSNKKMLIALFCLSILGGFIVSYGVGKVYDAAVELKQSRAGRAAGAVQDRVWEVFCWDEALERHSLRYVAPYKMSFEVEKGMCEALIK